MKSLARGAVGRGLLLISALLGGGCASGPPRTQEPPREPFAWELPPAEAAERPIVDPSKLHRSTLANGLQVVVLEDRRLPRLSAGFIALRGAAIEGPAEIVLTDTL